jgi:hypothetical protein
LEVQYRGSQGAAGNFVSSFWIANAAGTPCSLQTGVTIDLLDSAGNGLSAAASIESPLVLSAHSTMPSPAQDPAKGQVLGVLTVAWPTIANGALALGAAGGQCPQALFVPRSARITFAGVDPIVVDQLTNSGLPPPNSIPSICGSQLFIWQIGPLTAP